MKLKIELIAIVMLSMFMAALLLKPSNAQEPTTTVFIDCPDNVDIGIFQAKVNISNVIGLYGWEFKLYFNSTLLQFVSFTTANHFLESGGTTFQVDKSNNNFNDTHGLVWLADSLLGAPAGVNGSGTLVTLTFNATNVGYVELIFEDQLPLEEGKNIKLGDKSAQPIPNIAEDKTFNVIPEFPLPTLLIVLLTATSATLILAKKYKALK